LERFGTVAIVGVGLIGGSIGQALRAGGLARRVVGIGRDPARLEEARRLGAIDVGLTNVTLGVSEAEIVVVCTPVNRIAADVGLIAHACPVGTLITDAGSTKRAIVGQVEADPIARSKFVAAHPIAGSERAGVANARADLFTGRVCVLTPTDQTPPALLDRARTFWSTLGARLIELDPATHDDRLARTSHLPHALAAGLAAIVGPDLVPLAAGAYRDVTRVAGAEASLWIPIFLENRAAILDALSDYTRALDGFRDALDASDESRLSAWWDAARAHRIAFDLQNVAAPVASRAAGE
jgi:prephenate dehydrogenase